MDTFGRQMRHRDVKRLLYHFDKADTNRDSKIVESEIKAYGTNIGSKDPQNRGPNGKGSSKRP